MVTEARIAIILESGDRMGGCTGSFWDDGMFFHLIRVVTKLPKPAAQRITCFRSGQVCICMQTVLSSCTTSQNFKLEGLYLSENLLYP